MENTIQFQPEKISDHESLYAAFLILQDVHTIIQCIHSIVAVLLQYEKIGMATATSLIRFGERAVVAES